MRKLFVLLSLTLVLASCAAHGREVRADQLAMLKKGETTIEQAAYLLGKPSGKTILHDGSTLLTYVYVRAQARPETFIPIIGGFVGGADSYYSTASLTFGPDGVLKSYMSSEGGSGSGYGLASGSVRPRQEGPVEAPPADPEPEKPAGLPMAIKP